MADFKSTPNRKSTLQSSPKLQALSFAVIVFLVVPFGVTVLADTNLSVPCLHQVTDTQGEPDGIAFYRVSRQMITTESSSNASQSEVGAVLSPDGSKIAFISNETRRPELWVMDIDGSNKRKVSNLPETQGAANPVWSLESNLIAFTSFNIKGHSPLTSTHVWIAKADGSKNVKMLLPEPYTRFSTFSPLWVSKKILRVRATVLQQNNKLVKHEYFYNYKTEEIFRR